MTDALVHDWIDGRTGAERVLEALGECLPEADVFALSRRPEVNLDLGGRMVRTSMLDRNRLRDTRAVTLPLMAAAWARLARGRSYETVLISHHAAAIQFARHCRAQRRLAYVHSPARYIWTPEIDGRGARRGLGPARRALQRQDLRAVQMLDGIAVNSREVAKRVERYWDRHSEVIYPPVDVEFYGAPVEDAGRTRDFLLGVSRFVPYKRLDAVIAVGESLDLPVVLAGSGPEEARLRALGARASVPVTVLTGQSDESIRSLYRNALCLVFLAHEDFGIVPVEAQAAGTPVVGLAVGGTAETVKSGSTGYLVDEPDVASLAQAVGLASGLDPRDCSSWARSFAPHIFHSRVQTWLDQK